MRSVEGAGAVEPEGHGFDVDAEDPGRAGARAADERGGGDGGDGDVVLALYFVDGLPDLVFCSRWLVNCEDLPESAGRNNPRMPRLVDAPD